MLTRLRARAIDGATMLARYLDARRERDELQAEVERLTAENDALRAAGDRLVAETVSFATERGELLRLRRDVDRLRDAVTRAKNDVAKARRRADHAEQRATWAHRQRGEDGRAHGRRMNSLRAERDRLRHEVERLTAERDEHAQGVSVLACRIDRVRQERDAAMSECERLRTALDLNQRSRETSNASHEALRRELSKALTGDGVPLGGDDIVARVLAVIAERDARIPTDIDGAQAWAERHGVVFERTPSWRFDSDVCGWPEVGSREWAVAGGVASALRSRYTRDMQAGDDA